MGSTPRLRHLDAIHGPSWATLGRAVLDEPDYPQAIGGPLPLRPDPGVAPDPGRRPAPPGPSPDTLSRLFVDHEALDADAVATVLGTGTVDDLADAGLLAREGASVVARFGIERWGSVLVLHDWPEWGQDADYVMGVTNSARSLAYVTPRRRVGRVLDLGAGSGVQALLAATHADHVVATDVNDRAVALARASVLLNDVDNVEVRSGSWFDPVEGETFDLIVSNPPFVISPEDRFAYRDGGAPVDELCGSILGAVPAHLGAGGFAVMMAQWARRSGGEWWSAPDQWLAGIGADGLAIRYGSMTPHEYAVLWNRPSAPTAHERRAAVQRWLTYFAEHGVEELFEGVVAVAHHPGAAARPPDRWVVPAAKVLDGPGGDQLQRALAGHAAVGGATTADLLGSVPRPVDGHSLSQEIRFTDGGYAMGPIRGGFVEGIGLQAVLTAEELPLVLSFDGTRTLAELVDALDGDDGITPDESAGLLARLVRAGQVELLAPR